MATGSALNTPLVSAVVPAHDAEAHIQETLRSLLRQTYSNLEIIIVDDGSRDHTRQRAQSLAREHPRIRIIEQTCSGVAAARNSGIKASRGKFIAVVDSDDIWFPHAVEKLVDCLLPAGPEIGLAYGWWLAIDAKGQPLDGFSCSRIEGDVFATLVCHNFLGNGSSAMIRRECFEKVGNYDSSFRTNQVQGCEDWDLYLRIAYSYRFRVVPEFLFAYRRAGASMSYSVEVMAASHQYLLQRVKQRHPQIPKMLCRLSTSHFCLFLSHHCYHYENIRKSFQWLGRAFLTAPVFTLLHIRFYALLAQNLLRILGILITHHGSYHPPGKEQGMWRGRRMLRVEDMKRRGFHMRLNTASKSLLHRCISAFHVSRGHG